MRRIAIVGAGPAGAYLAYRLRYLDVTVDIFDMDTPAGLGSGCACGASLPGLRSLFCFDEGMMDLLKVRTMYVGKTATVQHGGKRFVVPVNELAAIEKNLLVLDMITRSHAHFYPKSRIAIDERGEVAFPTDNKDYDLIVDATGYYRRLLGPIWDRSKEFLLPCYMELVSQETGKGYGVRRPDDFLIDQFGAGYLWEFPWGNGTVNVGCGAEGAGVAKKHVREHVDKMGYTTLKSDGGVIRLTPPEFCEPFFRHNLMIKGHAPVNVPVVGIGEAIGCVSPATGEGIIPSMRSAELLWWHLWDAGFFEHPHQSLPRSFYDDYKQAIKNEFKSYRHEYGMIQAIRSGDVMAALWHGIQIPPRHDILMTKRQEISLFLEGVKHTRRNRRVDVKTAR